MTCSNKGYVHVKFNVEGIEFPMLFLVRNTSFNLFGLPKLQNFRCVIDKFPRTLSEAAICSLKHAMKVLEVAGQDIEVVIDTGASTMMTSPLSVVEDFDLELEDVEYADISFCGIGYTAFFK